MKDLGNRTDNSVIDFVFHSHLADGTPETLAGSPALAVYKGNNVAESSQGITLTTDFDTRVGLNHVRVDTSVDAFFEIGNDFTIVISQGTVNGIDVSGIPVATFSIKNRAGAYDSTVTGFSSAALSQLAGMNIQLVSPIADDGVISIVRGDDYAAVDGRAVDLKNEEGTWPDLTGATITLTAKLDTETLTTTGQVVTPVGSQHVQIELTSAETDLKPGIWDYDIQATLASGNIVTLQIGRIQVFQDVTV